MERERRSRARELGVRIGVMEPGPLNAITDVAGVMVGQTTRIEGDTVRTGVTAVVPHGGNLFQEKVPAGVHVGNGFGKLIGATQIRELGELEAPILLTSTLSAFRAADAVVTYTLSQPGNEKIRSVNPVVGETNDGRLNDIRGRHVSEADCLSAITSAQSGPVEEGAVGAGTGTIAFGFKGGIGSASRRLSAQDGGWTIGVLVQSNYGGVLAIAGAPVGEKLGCHVLGSGSYADEKYPAAESEKAARNVDRADGSVMVIIATDAPVSSRNLERIAARAMMGLARTGAAGSNGSGDYAIAFSVAPQNRIRHGSFAGPIARFHLSNSAMSPLFLATIEATEEAVINSLFRAISMTGCGHHVEALPIEKVLRIVVASAGGEARG